MTRLTDAELTTAKHNLLKGKVSLACEGLYLSPEQEAMFQGFEDERLSSRIPSFSRDSKRPEFGIPPLSGRGRTGWRERCARRRSVLILFMNS